jgi:hypothetical protein
MDNCSLVGNHINRVKKIEIIGQQVFFDGKRVGKLLQQTNEWFKVAYEIQVAGTTQFVEMKITFTEPINFKK